MILQNRDQYRLLITLYAFLFFCFIEMGKIVLTANRALKRLKLGRNQ